LDDVVGSMPLSAGSLSVRPRGEGPLEVLSTWTFEGTPVESSRPLTIGKPALQWLETKGPELVLAVRDEHRHSEFYRPFIEHGIRSALVVAIFHSDRIVGTVTVASKQRDAYTASHLRVIKLMSSELASHFPGPASVGAARPAPPAANETETREHTPHDAEEPPAPTAREHAPQTRPPDSPRACIEADSLGRIAGWDETAERIFGWSRSEAVGNFLTLFCRRKRSRLLDPTLLKELLTRGVFRFRAVGYDSRGLAVTCEVELSELNTPHGQTQGFRGVFRQVTPETLLAREKIQFEFARLYDFSNVLRGSQQAGGRRITSASAGS
jgi:PAS domain S-box-containing protein